MAKVYQLDILGTFTQAQFDNVAHSLIFADEINCASSGVGNDNTNSIMVVSGVESSQTTAETYLLKADDSQSEVSVDISSGKFVEGNLIAVLCPTSEAQSDLRDFMTFYATSGDIHLHVGVCNTTQSQDYTPAIIENSRVLKMVSPAQVISLGL